MMKLFNKPNAIWIASIAILSLSVDAIELDFSNAPLASKSTPTAPNVMLLIDDSGSMANSGSYDVFYSAGYNFNETYECSSSTNVIEPNDSRHVYAKIDQSTGTGYFSWGGQDYFVTDSATVLTTTPVEENYVCYTPNDDADYCRSGLNVAAKTCSDWRNSSGYVVAYGFHGVNGLSCNDNVRALPAASNPGITVADCRASMNRGGWDHCEIDGASNFGRSDDGYYRRLDDPLVVSKITTGGLVARSTCFDPNEEYNVYLKANSCSGSFPNKVCTATAGGQDDDPTSDRYVPQRFDGNYLNWYFSSSTSAWFNAGNLPTGGLVADLTRAGTDFDANSGYKDNTRGGQQRMEVAKDVAMLLTGYSTDLRIGISSFYNTSRGGEINHPLSLLGNLNTNSLNGGTEWGALATNRNELLEAINDLEGENATPFGEAMATIARYYALRPSGTANVKHDSFSGAGNLSNSASVFASEGQSVSLSGGESPFGATSSGTTNGSWCRKSYVVALTDGDPTSDTGVSGSARDWIDDERNESDSFGDSDERANDIAAAMYDIDFRPDVQDFNGDDVHHNVTTFTIGFGKDTSDSDFLKDVAAQGGGKFFSASSGVELAAAFRAIKEAIVGAASSVTSVAVSAVSELRTSNFVYKAGFETSYWSGDLLAFRINEDGLFENPDGSGDSVNSSDVSAAWSSKDLINEMYVDTDHANYRALSNRRIYTMNYSSGSFSAMPFNTTNRTSLPSTFQSDLDAHSTDATEQNELINFVRGDISLEKENPVSVDPKLRRRTDVSDGNNDGFIDTINDGAILGDVVNSAPQYLSESPRPWDDENYGVAGARYSTFASYNAFDINDYVTRPGMVYFGANDGMVHAVGANGFTTGAAAGNFPAGAELWSYIPSFVATGASNKGLHFLADPLYNHEFYVDAKSVVSEVYWNHDRAGSGLTGANPASEWRSILVGGAGAGGKGLYAIDITCPYDRVAYLSNVSADAGTCSDEVMLDPTETPNSANDIANFTKNFLWEFHSENLAGTDGTHLGYTFGSPVIAKVKMNRSGTAYSGNSDGEWAVIANNGYDSASGKAAIFIIFIDGILNGNGWEANKDYFILHASTSGVNTPNTNDTVGATANGLSSPTAVDTSGDGNVDYIYAGDLKGNMWAFDISDTTASQADYASKWSVRRLFQAGNLSAVDDSGTNTTQYQTITSAPRVQRNTDIRAAAPNLMVMFATGLYHQDIDVVPSVNSITTYAFQSQSVYGVLDDGSSDLVRSTGVTDLNGVARTVLEERFLLDSTVTDVGAGGVRRVRSLVDFNGANGVANGNITSGVYRAIDWSVQKGWYFNYDEAIELNGVAPLIGERTVYDPLLINDLIVVTTVIPTNEECRGGAQSYTFGFDWKTGMPPEFAILDANNNGSLDGTDIGWLGIFSESGAGQSAYVDGFLLTTQGLNTKSTEIETGAAQEGTRLGWEEKLPYGISK